MKIMNRSAFLATALLSLFLIACSEPTEKTTTPATPKIPVGDVYLSPDSPKRAYVQITNLSLTQHALLEPLVGKIVYNESVTSRISSPIAGRVISAPVTLGSNVSVGATLLELDSPDVADAQADSTKAQADLTLASHSFNRQQELYAGKAVARKELEQAQDELSRAKSDVQRTQQRLKNLHLNSGQGDGRFVLHSPMTGVVVERNVTPGMEIRPDLDAPLFVISNLTKLTVMLNVYETNLSKIKLGQKLSVYVAAYPNEKFPATVQYIGQTLDEATRTVQVRGELLNSNGRLLPNMYATIAIDSDVNDQAIVIPLTAIFTEDDVDYVFVVDDETHFKKRRVELGLRLKGTAVVINGLQPNEQLVTEGALMLRAEEDVMTESQKP